MPRFRVGSILVAGVSLVLAVCAETLIVFLYGEEFKPTAKLVVIMLPGFFIGGVGGILGSFFHGRGRAYLIPVVTLLPVLLQLVLAYLLVDRFGLMGLATAVCFGATVYGLALITLFVFVTKVRLSSLAPKMQDINFIFSFIVSTLKRR